MKVWALAGLFTVASVSWAAASESATECNLDQRRPPRIEATVAPLVEAHDVRKATVADRQEADNTVASQRPIVRAAASPRRRSGSQRRVPDAVLIDGRGVL